MTAVTAAPLAWWHPGNVGLLFRLVELLIVVVPIAGIFIAGVRTWQRIHTQADAAPVEPDTAVVTSPERSTANQVAQWRTITRILDEHSRTDARWLDYELD